MKKSFLYIVFGFLFLFLPFLNIEKLQAARVDPSVKLNTTSPTRIFIGTRETNDWKVLGTVSNGLAGDLVDVWLTQTGKPVTFRINPADDFKITKDATGAPTSFSATFKDLETGQYAIHSIVKYKKIAAGGSVAQEYKTPEIWYNSTTQKINYSSKLLSSSEGIVALPVVRDGVVKVKHIKNNDFEIRTTIDFYNNSKTPVIFLKNNTNNETKNSNASYFKSSDKTTSKDLFGEFYNLSAGSYTAYVVYKDSTNKNIEMARFSFSTTTAISEGEISGDKKVVDNSTVSDITINDVSVKTLEDGSGFTLNITGSDVPKDSSYQVVIWDSSGNTSSPAYIVPSTEKLVTKNDDGFLNIDATYSFSQITKSGKYSVLTKIIKGGAEKTILEERTSEIEIDKEGKKASLKASDVYNVPNTAIPESGVYKLLAPLPGIGTFFDYSQPDAFQKLINQLIKLFFGIITVYAVLVTIYWGIVYMTTEKEFMKSESKTKITNAIIAIVLALSSYLILNTINPDLVNLNVGADKVNINVEGFQPMSAAEYKNVTGKPLPTKPEILALADKLSKEQALDKCIILTVIAHESGGVPGFGPDENVPGTKSFRSFIASGQKYSGKPFTKGDTSARNDAKKDLSKPTFGLDWRFSKGIGFMQITFYPDNYGGSSSNYTAKPENRHKVASRTFNWRDGTTETVTPQEMIDLTKNITLGTKLFKEGLTSPKCAGNIEKGFKAFHSGNCNSTDPFAIEQARRRMATYNNCKSGQTVI